jgi:hypothetical protein
MSSFVDLLIKKSVILKAESNDGKDQSNKYVVVFFVFSNNFVEGMREFDRRKIEIPENYTDAIFLIPKNFVLNSLFV